MTTAKSRQIQYVQTVVENASARLDKLTAEYRQLCTEMEQIAALLGNESMAYKLLAAHACELITQGKVLKKSIALSETRAKFIAEQIVNQ